MFFRLKRLFSKPAAVEFRDPGLGLLTFDRGVWSGGVERDGGLVPFYLAGTEAEPDATLAQHVRDVISRLPEVEREALEFLRIREHELRNARLDVYAVEFLWPDRPADFTVEFLADGSDSQVWRVDFVAGRPHQTGFDD